MEECFVETGTKAKLAHFEIDNQKKNVPELRIFMSWAQFAIKSMKKVLAELIGDKLDIEDLQSGLSSINWTITKDEDKYYLNSELLDELSDNREIVSKAGEFLDIINGGANVLYSNHERVKVGNLKIIKDNGANHVLITGTARIKLKSRLRETLTTNTENDQPIIETWLDKSQTNQDIRDVLHFFNEITWWNLYKIFEIIRDDAGGQKGLYKLADRNELKHFSQAAQSRELLGDKARHASKKYKAPLVDLTIDQGTDIIARLFRNWVTKK